MVVPPTPGAAGGEPANPTDHPAAILPILIGESVAYVLEVFLPPGGTAAVWRGTLRFLDQLVSLATEFFVADRLRQMTRHRAASTAADAVVLKIQAAVQTGPVAALLVDHLARWPASATVALWDRLSERWLAVGDVDQIDQAGDASRRLRAAIPAELRRPSDSMPLWSSPLSGMPGWCVATDAEAAWRLVITGPDASDGEAEPDPLEHVDIIARLLAAAEASATSIRRIEALPLGGTYLRKIASDGPPEPIPRSRRRRAVYIAAAMVATLLLAIPVPRIVPARGRLQPTRHWTAFSPADAVVEQLFVVENQNVAAGDRVLSLRSDSLSSQRGTLTGQLAVLRQRQIDERLRYVDRSSAGDETGDPTLPQQIDAAEAALQLVESEIAALTVTAAQPGRISMPIDGPPQVDQPVDRGESLLRVVGTDTGWEVVAELPQTRVRPVMQAAAAGTLRAWAAARWTPGRGFALAAPSFGPVVQNRTDQTAMLSVRMAVDPGEIGLRPVASPNPPIAGTPVEVTLDCGRVTIGGWLFGELTTWLRVNWQTYGPAGGD